MNRRDFLKIVGITTATSTAALYGCGSKEGSSEGSKVLGPIPTDKMTYRSFPGLGSDKVSILGYGCSILPPNYPIFILIPGLARVPSPCTVSRSRICRWTI